VIFLKTKLLIKKIVCVCLILALNISNNFLHETQKINKVYAEELINLDIPAWDGETVASGFAGGDGTQGKPYQISNGEELAYLAEVINKNDTNYNNNNCYFELTNDIDLANKEWTSIGNGFNFQHSFFNGNGYKIYNLTMTTKDLNLYGLFGYVVNSTIIHDINIINCNINVNTNSYDVYISALACYVINSSIYNCSASGTITAYKPSETDLQYMFIGGLCGGIDSADPDIYTLFLENCKSDVDISFSGFYAVSNIVIIGGMIGFYVAGAMINIDNCSYTGNIEVTSDLNHCIVGGLVGELGVYVGYGSFTSSNSYFVGNIIVQNCNDICIGGLFADSNGPLELNNCFSSCNIVAGEISGDSDYYAAVGGLIGQNYGTCNVTNCYSAHGNISIGSIDNSYVGGLIGNGGDNTNSLTNCYSGNIVKVFLPADINNIGSFIGNTNAATISNCYFNKDLSEYVSASEKDNENIIGLTTDQMTGYSALKNMSGLFEVTDSNTDPAFDVVDTFDVDSNKYYYSHYPQLKVFLNNKDWNAICYSEFSTRAKLTNVIEDICKIQNLLEYLVDNIDRKFERELDVIKCNQNQIENKINAIFMKICGKPVCDTDFNCCN
jgi:hypothetical protein